MKESTTSIWRIHWGSQAQNKKHIQLTRLRRVNWRLILIEIFGGTVHSRLFSGQIKEDTDS